MGMVPLFSRAWLNSHRTGFTPNQERQQNRPGQRAMLAHGSANHVQSSAVDPGLYVNGAVYSVVSQSLHSITTLKRRFADLPKE